MKSNVIRKLLPVMLTITLTAGIAPVSYAAAEEPAQQTEGVDEEPVQDFENEDADDQISDGNNQTEEAEEVREPEVREPDLNTSEDDSEDTDAVQQDKSEKVKTQTETENMDELAGVYRDVIPDGEYVIGEKGSRQVLDVKNGSKADSANVQAYQSNMTAAQRWKVVHDSKGYLILSNTGSGKVLDVNGGIAANGQNVQQYTKNMTAAQKWVAVPNEEGTIILYSALGKKLVLNVTDSNNVEICEKTDTSGTDFAFYSTQTETVKSERTIEDGTYLITNGDQTLTINSGSDGSGVRKVSKDGKSAKKAFYIAYNEKKAVYTICSVYSGRFLDANLGDVVPGAVVSASGTEAGKALQRFWKIEKDENGQMYIRNAANNQMLGSAADGELITVPADDERVVRWTFEQSDFYWSEKEIDTFAATKAEISDLTNGTYQITTSIKTEMTLDVSNGSKNDRAKIQLYESNNTNAQRWKVEATGDGYVRILNIGSGKVLDVSNGTAKSGTAVQQFQSNNSRAQKWIPVKNENGTYTFYSALGRNLVLDVSGAGSANGTQIQIYDSNETPAQMFKVYNTKVVVASEGKVLEDGYYALTSLTNNKMVLDLSGANSANGTKLQMYQSNGTLAQCFEVKYCKDGYYRLRIVATAKTVDLKSGGLIPGTIVQEWQNDDNTKNQRWVIRKNEDGSYTLISAANGLAMDAGKAVSGETVTTQETTESTNQKWQFVPFKASVSEGCYIVESALASQKVIDITNGSTAVNANAQLYSYNKTMAQKWQVRTTEDGYITLQNVGSGLYLTESGNNVCQADNSGDTEAAQWSLEVQMGGGYILINKASGKAIDVSGGNTANGTNIGTYIVNGTKAQAWKFNSASIIETGFYEFAPLTNTGLRMDVAGGSSNNGANVQVYSSNGSYAQRWWVRSAGNGWYTITSCCSAKLLDVQNASTAAGANVQQYQNNGSNAQKWKFVMGEKGIQIVSALGNVVDVKNASGKSGANVQVWSKNSSDAQQWRIYTAARPNKIGWQNPSGYPQVSSKTVVLPSYCTGYFTYVSPSTIAYDATREDCINAFIRRAYEYIGTRYIEPWSSWPGDAVDCSGFVLQCLYATGMDLGIYNPYNHRWQAWQTYNSMNWYRNNTFKPVSTSNMQRGDLIYYNGHVAIYLGNGMMIDSWPNQGVGIHPVSSRGTVIGAARPYV